MRWQCYKKYIFIFVFVFACVLQSNIHAASIISSTDQDNETLKSELLVSAKGLIQPAPEVCNGGSVQYHIQKFKNSFGGTVSFYKRNVIHSFDFASGSFSYEKAKVSLFLFNRSIII